MGQRRVQLPVRKIGRLEDQGAIGQKEEGLAQKVTGMSFPAGLELAHGGFELRLAKVMRPKRVYGGTPRKHLGASSQALF